MNVYQILIIYLIPEQNNSQKVCFKGNLNRLVPEPYTAYQAGGTLYLFIKKFLSSRSENHTARYTAGATTRI
jgi:hypothetical protein